MTEDSPVEDHDGLWIKREDLYVGPLGVNGSKYRTWKSVVAGMDRLLLDFVVVAGSVHAPTVPIAAVACREAGVPCTVIVGGTTPEKAVRNPYIAKAAEAGALITAIKVGYAPALKKAAREVVYGPEGGGWVLAPPEPGKDGSAEFEAFLGPVGGQVRTLPAEVETLVIPFGSGNTAAGILYGLSRFPGDTQVKRVVLVGIGPDRFPWLKEMLEAVGAEEIGVDVEIVHLQTHPWFAEYSDRMKETFHGIEMHPTYEGKVVRYLNLLKPDWWTRRDGTTCLWIVGGPIA